MEQSYKKALAQATTGPAAKDNPEAARTSANFSARSGRRPRAGSRGAAARTLANFFGALNQASQGQSGSSPDLAKILATLGNSLQGATAGAGGNVVKRPAGTCPAATQKALVSYMHDAASTSIPLEAGLTLTNVWTPSANQPDVEILISVDSIAGDTVQVTGKRLVGDAPPDGRNLCTVDLLDAHEYETGFGTSTPNTIPGATMFTMSRAVFSDLKAGRPSAFTFYDANNDPSGGYDLHDLSKGTLSRVEKSDVPYSIIVNGEQKNLPTLHVKGVLGSHTFELWVLDDVNNPLVLNLKDD